MAVLAERSIARVCGTRITSVRIRYAAPKFYGPIAHLGERRTCNAEAVGAEPTRSTKFDWCLTCNDVRVKASRVARRKVEAR